VLFSKYHIKIKILISNHH